MTNSPPTDPAAASFPKRTAMGQVPPTAPDARPAAIPPPPLPAAQRTTVALTAVGFVAAAMVALALSGLAPSGMDNPWYAAANRPPITPPGFVFPLVWVPLYFVMGISAFLVWGEVKGQTLQAFPAFTLWGVQLILSIAWSWAFFGLRAPWLSLVVIVLLWLTIAAMIAAFWRVHAGAGAMNLPYLAWVSFATILNLWFALIN